MSILDFVRKTVIAGSFVAVAALASQAQAVPFSFTKFTNNNVEDLSGQLLVDVTADGVTGVFFTFTNNVGIASSITDIYFDDSSPFSLSSPTIFAQSAGVSFSIGASPPNVPGGNDIGFAADFAADSDAPVSANGVNTAAESLTIRFALANSLTFADVIARLNADLLRVALHVQSIGTAGGSDGYVTGGDDTPVPEPTTLGLLGLGLLGLGYAIRRRRQI